MANILVGRRPLNIDEKKTERVYIRLTKMQKKELLNEAKNLGFSSLTALLLNKIYTKISTKNTPQLSLEQFTIIEKSQKEISRIASNINQVTKKINSLSSSENDIKAFVFNLNKIRENMDEIAIEQSNIYKILDEISAARFNR